MDSWKFMIYQHIIYMIAAIVFREEITFNLLGFRQGEVPH